MLYVLTQTEGQIYFIRYKRDNMAHWTMDLNKYANKLKVKIDEVKTTYAFALYSSIVKRTPVDTGRARANWNISVGSSDLSVDDKSKYGKSKGKKKSSPQPISESEMKYKSPSSLPKAKGDESIFIANNLEYIQKLEHGSSKQAPSGMVGLTLANNKNIFASAVERVKSENK